VFPQHKHITWHNFWTRKGSYIYHMWTLHRWHVYRW